MRQASFITRWDAMCLQAPYSNYHTLADTMLQLLPAHEETVRTVAIALSAVANIIVVVLIIQLIFDWLFISDIMSKILIALVVIVGVPEFFYIGLVYSPTLFAFALLLTSHLLLHRIDFSTRSRSHWLTAIASVILFGLGAAFR